MARVARRTGALMWQVARWGWDHPTAARFRGGLTAAFGAALILAFATYNAADPSWNAASDASPTNLLGGFGANLADLGMQSLGLAAWVLAALMVMSGLGRAADRDPAASRARLRLRTGLGALGILALAGLLAAPRPPAAWPLARGLGGVWGDGLLNLVAAVFLYAQIPLAIWIAAAILAIGSGFALAAAIGLSRRELAALGGGVVSGVGALRPHRRPRHRRAP